MKIFAFSQKIEFSRSACISWSFTSFALKFKALQNLSTCYFDYQKLEKSVKVYLPKFDLEKGASAPINSRGPPEAL